MDDTFETFVAAANATLTRSHSGSRVGITEVRGFGAGWLVLFYKYDERESTSEARVAYFTFANREIRTIWDYIAGAAS